MRCMLPLVLFLVVGPAAAQDPGDIIVGFEAESPYGCAWLSGFEYGHLYIQAWEVGDINGWESALNWSDPTWLVFNVTLNPEDALNVGSVGNFIVGLGACVQTQQLHTLATYEFGYFGGPVAPYDAIVCVGPSSPSSLGAYPGYTNCSNELMAFGVWQNGAPDYPNGCGHINPTAHSLPASCTTVATESQSWGGLKGRFR